MKTCYGTVILHRLKDEVNMAFIDEYDFAGVLKNEAESLIIAELEKQLENYPAAICRCNDCVIDMAAVALNNVKPLYRVSLLGIQYTARAMEEPGYAVAVRNAVRQAIERVRKNPSHD
ncbi:MAG: late competence development ComFB family protein [Spirochaetaceae bacterium]|jgi:competence protein ComFB|nr:late competence development ComFB family protein [Spirochaetaceae bacterium]